MARAAASSNGASTDKKSDVRPAVVLGTVPQVGDVVEDSYEVSVSVQRTYQAITKTEDQKRGEAHASGYHSPREIENTHFSHDTKTHREQPLMVTVKASSVEEAVEKAQYQIAGILP
ncbi:gp080 [Rhodococcus phage ReqiDocB7]|uniref:gp080 n=1 Tax=Rhodococcus phage ReqiDocB7 TaxID=691966 RepID=UPI0001CDD869|nr:gp080 [Rhodococcus phage ReqiDocB7]ADD80866.1 gp080 [Rhodococcus phage ReqiDocB7]